MQLMKELAGEGRLTMGGVDTSPTNFRFEELNYAPRRRTRQKNGQREDSRADLSARLLKT